MPVFTAITLDDAGRRSRGAWHAPDVSTLRLRLRARKLWIIGEVAIQKDRNARLYLPTGDLVPLLEQWELFLRAGERADVALEKLALDLPKGAARTLLQRLHAEVAAGSPIHVACRTFGRIFPPHLAAVIAAGEASAQLPDALRALAVHLTANDELRRTVRRALIYPTLVLIATGVLVLFLLGGVVPRFAEIFASINLPLPGLTVAFIRASELLRHGWPLLLVAAGTLGAVLAAAARAARLRYARDWITLQIPVLGETVRCLATARFAAHTRLLHEAGVPLLDALETGAELTGHAVLAGQLRAARGGIAAGKPLCEALPPNHGFPPFVVPALRAGETTGQFGESLRHVEHYATRRARERLATSLALLEPILLAGLTAIVGAIALSFFLPLFSLLGGVNSR